MPESALKKITKHVYWMPPGPPDRPSLCAVVGSDRTLMLDAGASDAHTRLFLDELIGAGVPAPQYVVLTHWHWDHVFGAATLNVPVIAHTQTADQLALLAGYDWSDAALDQRVASGDEISMCAENIKLELPEPRDVRIVQPDIVFEKSLDVHLGDVTCQIRHVGGDHASDSCMIHVVPDRLLFLGDCLYDAIYSPVRHYTPRRLFPLIETILSYDADHFVEGHGDSLLSRAELETMIAQMRRAAALVDQFGTDESTVLAQVGETLDEDMTDFVRAFIAGRQFL